jgi:hypothetical protein
MHQSGANAQVLRHNAECIEALCMTLCSADDVPNAAPAESTARGFSKTACLPALSAASPSGTWLVLRVQTWVTSMAGSSLIGSTSVVGRSKPSAAALDSTWVAVWPASTTTSA